MFLRIIILLVLMFGLLSTSSSLRSEGNCPPGMVPIGGGQAQGASCMPIGGSQQQPHQAYWQNRYGAIATGWVPNSTGSYNLVVGVASNMRSKRKAEKQAISQCKSKGSKSCKVMNYYNQCAVLASGDGGSYSRGAETLQIARQLAIDACLSEGGNCKILYSDCSFPELVK
jgi:hypothetical protein